MEPNKNNDDGINSWNYYFDEFNCPKIYILKDCDVPNRKIENCYLDIIHRKLYLPISMYPSLEMDLVLHESINAPFHVMDKNDKKYTLLHQGITESAGSGYAVNFDEIVVGDFIDKPIEFLSTTKYEYRATYAGSTNLAEQIEDVEIQFDDNVTLKIINSGANGNATYITISLFAKTPANLFTYVYRTLDLLFLYIGQMPLYGYHIVEYNGASLYVYKNQIERYKFNRRVIDFAMIQKINSNTFTGKILKSFIDMRINTQTLIDVFLYAANAGHYPDAACINLILALEGTANSIDKKSGGLPTILKKYIGNGTDNMKKVFNYSEDELIKFRTRIDKFRNQYAHFDNDFRTTYTSKEYNYLKFRLELIIRLLLFQKINIDVDQNMFDAMMSLLECTEKKQNVNILSL